MCAEGRTQHHPGDLILYIHPGEGEEEVMAGLRHPGVDEVVSDATHKLCGFGFHVPVGNHLGPDIHS